MVALVGLVAWLGSSALVARRFTRRSGPPHPEPAPKLGAAVVESRRLETADGQELGGWLVRGDRAKGCVLLLHGNGASRGGMVSVICAFLEQPYKDLASATWNRLECHLPPVLDHVAYLGLKLWGPVFLPAAPEQISPYEHVAEIPESVPVVFLAGAADRYARLEDVAAMYGRVQSHARLVVFEGAGHGPLNAGNPRLYWSSLYELLGYRPEEKIETEKGTRNRGPEVRSRLGGLGK
jgi:hypothetical protein